LSIVAAGHNLAVTGPAGSGKTALITSMVNDLKSGGKRVAVTASTAVAAINLGLSAQTLHSFCGLLDGRYSPQVLVHRLSDDEAMPGVRTRLQLTDVLIIDEASMISERVLQMVDAVLRASRSSPAVFGGIQMIVVLDPLQLPPVPNVFYDDNGLYPFLCPLW
jgi:ATP-dependent DNA helicase PIF1